MSQIRRRVRDAQVSQELPEVLEERIRARVRAAVDLDGERPFEVQRALHLGGTWNVTPQDLIESKRRGAGSLLSVFRRAARPGLKLFANLELPLYQQLKINLFLTMMVGSVTCCFSLKEIRTRMKLIEVSIIAAVVVFITTAVIGVIQTESNVTTSLIQFDDIDFLL